MKPPKGKRPAAARPPVTGGFGAKKILVPIDFSPPSIQALHAAVPYAKQFGATLHLVHVVEPAPFLADLRNVPLAMSEAEVARKAAAELASLAQREVEPGLPVRTHVRTGKPFHEITRAARELGAGLIALGTHGYTGLKHTLLGSTAERVVRHATCPVLVVR